MRRNFSRLEPSYHFAIIAILVFLASLAWFADTVDRWNRALSYRPSAVVQPGEYRLDFRSDAYVRVNLKSGVVIFSDNTDLDEASKAFWMKVAEQAKEEERRKR